LSEANRTARKLADLRALLAGKATMVIVLQDDPDPDALGSAAALRKLANTLAGVSCSLACGGTVGRAENRALARYLDLNLRPLAQLDLAPFDLVAMVDTQPGHGNQSLPANLVPHVVLDHHPCHRETRAAAFRDVRRRYGATSTILHEYLREAGIVPEAPLATALLYGIRSDTQDLGREATRADVDAYETLYPLANKRMLGTIQRGEVPSAYFRLLAAAIERARLCGRSMYCELGDVDNADMIAEVADLLLRHEDADWSLCWGYHEGRALLSVRTIAGAPDAASVVRRLVSRRGTGGGHQTMAGGQVTLRDDSAAARRRLDRLIRQRFLRVTGAETALCRRLL